MLVCMTWDASVMKCLSPASRNAETDKRDLHRYLNFTEMRPSLSLSHILGRGYNNFF